MDKQYLTDEEYMILEEIKNYGINNNRDTRLNKRSLDLGIDWLNGN